MDFKAQRYVLKIAECRSISEAAAQLYISQPSLSYYLGKIERELGNRIFDRSIIPLRLTPFGERYVEIARQIIALDASLRDESVDYSTYKKGKLTIGISHIRSAYMFPTISKAFHEYYPGVSLYPVEGSMQTLVSKLEKGEVDVAIFSNSVFHEKITCEMICYEHLKLVTPKNYLRPHHFLDNGGLNWLEIFDLPFVIMSPSHSLRSFFNTFCEQAGKIAPHVIMETGSVGMSCQMAVHGQAVTILPDYVTRYMRVETLVDEYELGAKPSLWPVCLAHRASHPLTFLEQEMLSICRKIFDHP